VVLHVDVRWKQREAVRCEALVLLVKVMVMVMMNGRAVSC